MRIGIAYDLREDYLACGFGVEETAEFDSPRTIAAIDESLRLIGHKTERIGNLRALVRALAQGKRWDMVFNIAEGLYGYGREAAIPALLDAWRIPYTFSDPLTAALTLHKGMAKRVVRDAGINTPDFAMVETLEDLDQFRLEYPLFAKPVAEGTSKGVTGSSLILDPERLRPVCAHLLAEFAQPVLVERYLPGREFTVGILGTGRESRSIGVMEVFIDQGDETKAYTYANKANYLDRVRYVLANDADAKRSAKLALAAWKALGCRDGGRVDVRLDEKGEPQFIEANPLPGLNPVDSDLPIMCGLAGIPYVDLIAEIVRSAETRLILQKNRTCGEGQSRAETSAEAAL